MAEDVQVNDAIGVSCFMRTMADLRLRAPPHHLTDDRSLQQTYLARLTGKMHAMLQKAKLSLRSVAHEGLVRQVKSSDTTLPCYWLVKHFAV